MTDGKGHGGNVRGGKCNLLQNRLSSASSPKVNDDGLKFLRLQLLQCGAEFSADFQGNRELACGFSDLLNGSFIVADEQGSPDGGRRSERGSRHGHWLSLLRDMVVCLPCKKSPTFRPVEFHRKRRGDLVGHFAPGFLSILHLGFNLGIV